MFYLLQRYNKKCTYARERDFFLKKRVFARDIPTSSRGNGKNKARGNDLKSRKWEEFETKSTIILPFCQSDDRNRRQKTVWHGV
jgi:hypothetical protein